MQNIEQSFEVLSLSLSPSFFSLSFSLSLFSSSRITTECWLETAHGAHSTFLVFCFPMLGRRIGTAYKWPHFACGSPPNYSPIVADFC